MGHLLREQFDSWLFHTTGIYNGTQISMVGSSAVKGGIGLFYHIPVVMDSMNVD